MYRHEFRKNFAMMQPPKMHEICPRGTKNEKKCNEQKLISIFHFFCPNFSNFARRNLREISWKTHFLKCFPPLIGVDFAHNPSSPYHWVRSGLFNATNVLGQTLTRPTQSFVYPRAPWVIRDHSPFAQPRQLVSRMWKICFVQVHPLSSCVRPAQLYNDSYVWVIIAVMSHMIRPALSISLPPSYHSRALSNVPLSCLRQ
jgi:hypothetical protein